MFDTIFRMYDIRGIADSELTDAFTFSLGRAYGTLVRKNKGLEVAVGYDARLSSPRLNDALCDGITSTGVNVISIGMVPTPLLYFSVIHFNLNGGIMITGSHNPIEYNGFKIMLGERTLYGEDIQILKKMILNKEFLEGKGKKTTKDFSEDYISKVLSIIYPLKKLKIVIDPGNGTGGIIAKKIFNKLGASIECINCEPDGRFPAHLPDPTIPEYMESLKQEVIENKADIGVGYDGDADRIGVIDEKGNIVWGDKILAIFAKYAIKRFPNSYVIFDVKCSQGVEEYIESIGGRPVMWKTGHSLIKAKMKQLNAPLAGEMSGHIFCAGDYYGYDDAIFASAKLYEILSRSDKTISEMLFEIPAYYSTPEIRLETSENKKWKIVEDVKNHFSKNFPVIDIDGARIKFKDGWGLVRASNTQPVIVARFEAKTPERLKEIENIVLGYINERKDQL